MEVIIRRSDKYKGRNVSEMQDNLASEGWPVEFTDEVHRDKVRWFEKKKSRPMGKREISKALNGNL